MDNNWYQNKSSLVKSFKLKDFMPNISALFGEYQSNGRFSLFLKTITHSEKVKWEYSFKFKI